jgi:hypothetical protein
MATDINGLYKSLLGRDGDEAGIKYWQGQLDSGALTQDNLKSTMENSLSQMGYKKNGNGVYAAGDSITSQNRNEYLSSVTSDGHSYEGVTKLMGDYDAAKTGLLNGAATTPKTSTPPAASVTYANGALDPYAVADHLNTTPQGVSAQYSQYNDLKGMRGVDWNSVFSSNDINGALNSLKNVKYNTGALGDSVESSQILADRDNGLYRYGNIGVEMQDTRSGSTPRITFYDDNGQKLTTQAFSPSTIPDSIMRFGINPGQLNGLADLLDENGIQYQPGQLYAGTGSNLGIDLRGLASGGMGTTYDWTRDPNAASKGPSGLRTLAENQATWEAWQQYLQGVGGGIDGRQFVSGNGLSDGNANAGIPGGGSIGTGGNSQNGAGVTGGYGPNYQGINLTAFAGSPVTRTVAPEETMQYQLGQVLDSNSPLMQRARNEGMAYANSRGLLNSSLAGEAAQAAMIDRAAPIAQFDAGVYANQALTNQGVQNEFALNDRRFGQSMFAQDDDQAWRSSETQKDRDFNAYQNESQRAFEAGSQMAIERLKQNSGLYAQFLQGMSDINSADMDQGAKDSAMSALWDAIQQGTSMATALSGVRFEGGKLVYDEVPTGNGSAQVSRPQTPQENTTSMTWGDGGIYTPGVTRNSNGDLVDKNGNPAPQGSSGFTGLLGGGRQYELVNGEWKAVGGNYDYGGF